MEILALIPARSGSKRLPNKNNMLFKGTPMITLPIEQARDSKYITRTVVVTDDSVSASIARQYHCEIINEPQYLAKDDVAMKEVVKWTLEHLQKYESYKPYYFILLQPSSPLRTVEDIDSAIKLMIDKDADSVDSRCKGKQNGAIYICKPHILTGYDMDFIGHHHYTFDMAEDRSADVDTLKDFQQVEDGLEIIKIKKEKKK